MILYIYLNGTSTSPFAACSVNKKRCEEAAVITKSSPFPKCLFLSDVFAAVYFATVDCATGALGDGRGGLIEAYGASRDKHSFQNLLCKLLLKRN